MALFLQTQDVVSLHLLKNRYGVGACKEFFYKVRNFPTERITKTPQEEGLCQ